MKSNGPNEPRSPTATALSRAASTALAATVVATVAAVTAVACTSGSSASDQTNVGGGQTSGDQSIADAGGGATEGAALAQSSGTTEVATDAGMIPEDQGIPTIRRDTHVRG